MPENGGCLCGAVRYSVQRVERAHSCHCEMCRRATRSAFAVLAWASTADLTWICGADHSLRVAEYRLDRNLRGIPIRQAVATLIEADEMIVASQFAEKRSPGRTSPFILQMVQPVGRFEDLPSFADRRPCNLRLILGRHEADALLHHQLIRLLLNMIGLRGPLPDPDRPGDVLDALGAQIAEVRAEPLTDVWWMMSDTQMPPGTASV